MSVKDLRASLKNLVPGADGRHDQAAGCQMKFDAAPVVAGDVPARERNPLSLQEVLDPPDVLAADASASVVVGRTHLPRADHLGHEVPPGRALARQPVEEGTDRGVRTLKGANRLGDGVRI